MSKNVIRDQKEIDSIAEQWVNIVLAHLRAKKLNKMKKNKQVANKK